MRVVSLCPSLTELVYDLRRGEDLVGITEYCVHPADRVAFVEKVGGTKTPDVRRIAVLEPDVVLLNEEENRREDEAALRDLGVNCLTTFPRNCDDTAKMVELIGAVLERVEEAARIATDIRSRSKRVRAAAVGRPETSWAYLIWRKPWMSVNADTFVNALLAQAGGRNVFADLDDRYPTIELEDLATRNPDRVFLCTEPFPFKGKHINELSEATGFSPQRFQIADGEYLSWHGSRTPDGIDYAESLLTRACESET